MTENDVKNIYQSCGPLVTCASNSYPDSIADESTQARSCTRYECGSIHAAFALDALLNRKITHVLNVSRLPSTFPAQFTYLSIDIRDKDDANILSCIPASNIFIEAGAEAGGVLVHCFGGRSRSAALVAAYLMSSARIDADEAIQILTNVRPAICINRGFELQLRAYSQSNYDVYVAQQVLLRGRIRALYSLHIEGKSPGSQRGSPTGQLMPIRKRSKDMTDDDTIIAMVSDEDKMMMMEGISIEDDDYRHQLRLKKQSVASVTLSNLRSLIPLVNAKPPVCRLTRPGSAAIRIIPPLRGAGREFCCSWCSKMLFNLANVVRLDVEAEPLFGSGSQPQADAKYGGTRDDAVVDPISDMTGGVKNNGYTFPVFSEQPARSGSRLMPYRFPVTARHDAGNKQFDYVDIKNGPLDSIDEFKAESKDSSQGSSRSIKLDEDDPMEIVVGRRTSHTRSGSGLSRQFSFTGPVDDDDTWSVVSSAFDDGNSPSATRRSSAKSTGVPQLKGIGRSSSPGVRLSGRFSVDADDSPRIPIPPHRAHERSPVYRPQSAEKSRWLARVNLLTNNNGSGVARMVQDDEEALRLGWGSEKYIYLEFLEWMGNEALQGSKVRGPLQCSGCHNVIGSYDWSPTNRHTLGGRLEAPLYKVLKNVVNEAAIALDNTPANTPRIGEEI